MYSHTSLLSKEGLWQISDFSQLLV